jgi:ubiquinone/menaquinone biosynthesis C-methylase UbiE
MENYDRVVVDLSTSRPGLPQGLIQPADKCHSPQTPQENKCAVSSPNSVVLWGGRIPDFLGADGRRAVEILRWDDSFIDLAAAALPDIAAGNCAAQDLMTEMQAKGLIDSDRKLTKLGAKLAYHLAEYKTQSDPLEACDLAEDMEFGNNTRVLDIGCGGGQTLYRLQRFGLAECIGIDYDIEALAWGYRMQPFLGASKVDFVCASGEAIPFVDNRFTHILSRVALNLMHHAHAVREAVRVLEPGGMLSFRVENFGMDLRRLCKSQNIQRAIINSYKLGWGCVAALTGFQFKIQRRLAVKQMFLPLFRFRKLLHKAGCDVVRWRHTSRFLGFPISTTVVAKKRQ